MKRDQSQLQTVQLPPLSLSAAISPSSVNEEERAVELTFSTGAAVERVDWWSGKRYVEKLSLKPEHIRLDRLNDGAPVLNAHSAWSVSDVLGVVVSGSAKVSGKKASARARFSERADVEPIWQDVRGGIVRNVSVGYRVHKFEEANGKEGALPVRTATDWEPFEISMVPMGADPGARVRGERAEANPCVIVRSMEEPMDPKTTARQDGPTADGAPATPAEPTAAPPTSGHRSVPDQDRETRAAAAQEERARAETIRTLVRRAGLQEAFADELVKEGATLDAARTRILDKLAESSDATAQRSHVRVGEDVADKRRQGITAWLLTKAGVAGMVRRALEATPEHRAFAGTSFEPGEFRGLSLLELGRADLEARGIRTAGLGKMELAAQVLRGVASGLGAQTTSDFAVALENVLNKTLLGAYTITPDTWRRFCAVGSVTDFRAHNRYRTGYLGSLDLLNEAQEFQNKAVPDAVKETIQALTKGNILALTRQDLVNDDMGIFSRVATQAGRAAALSIELDVYALLAENSGLGPNMNDGDPLFDGNHDNIATGSALTVAGLDDDRVVMASQTDPSGNEILNLRPDVLLVPIGLGGEARVINDAEYDTDASVNERRPNKVRGLFRDIVDTPHLSGTRRYLFTDPGMMPVLEVAFLEGAQEPFLEMQEGWRVDGVEWKVRLDYGVAAVEFRGAVTNAGA